MKKKSNKPTFVESDNGKKIRLCQEKGCLNEGEYIAPKSPNSKEKYFFCLDHIKIYNKRWNYFAGKSQKQIYDFQKNDLFEGRPTRPFSMMVQRHFSRKRLLMLFLQLSALLRCWLL